MSQNGKVLIINGPVVKAELPGAKLYELVFVGSMGLFGEVVRIQGDVAFIQVYEDTTNLSPPGEPVTRTGEMLSAWLGPPGIIGQVYDGGVQRPLKLIYDATGRPFIARGGSITTRQARLTSARSGGSSHGLRPATRWIQGK